MRKAVSVLIALGIVLYALYGLSPGGVDMQSEDFAEQAEDGESEGRDPAEEKVVDQCAAVIQRVSDMGLDEMEVGNRVRDSLGPEETIALCEELEAMEDAELRTTLTERFGI